MTKLETIIFKVIKNSFLEDLFPEISEKGWSKYYSDEYDRMVAIGVEPEFDY